LVEQIGLLEPVGLVELIELAELVELVQFLVRADLSDEVAVLQKSVDLIDWFDLTGLNELLRLHR
jgi:hypothetical protein